MSHPHNLPSMPFVPPSTSTKNTPQDFPISCGVFLHTLFFYHMTSYFMPRLHFSETGASCLHFSVAFGQRVENAQPLKSSVLTGCSPESSENPSRSIYGSGTEAKSPFVYGWSGFANNSSVSVSSTSVPRYITPIRSEIKRITPISCEINKRLSPSSF